MAWIPRTRGGRIRLVTLAFGLLLTNSPVLQLDQSMGNGGATGISLAAIILLDVILLATAMLRRQLTAFEGPATAVLAILVGIGLQVPLGVITLCVGVMVAQSMYGGGLSEVLRVVAFLPVVPVSVALSVSPLVEHTDWHSGASLSLIALPPIFAALVHMLKAALEGQAHAKRRARFMARLTGDLLATTTIQQAMPVLEAAATEICRITPGLVAVAVRLEHHDDGPATARIEGIAGAPSRDLPTELPAGTVAALPDSDAVGLHEIPRLGKQLADLGLPGRRRWFAHADAHPLDGRVVNLALFGVPTSLVERALNVLGPRNAELIGILHNLADQRATTFGYLLEKRTMMLTANRDDVTGLAKRSSFLRRLDQLVQDGANSSVALIMIGLDGLAPLARERGFPTAAAVASRLARRLVAIVGDRGSTGRFSDNRFVIAVPVTGPQDDVRALAGAVRAALSEPVPLEGGSITLSVSAGIARAGTGTSGWDLSERAAVALRLSRQASTEPLVSTA